MIDNINLDNLNNLDLSKLSDDQVSRLVHLLRLKKDYDKYNVIESFSPYEYQLKFYEAGKKYKRRFLCAANR